MASPADQASEIARLRRELDRVWMERDITDDTGRPGCMPSYGRKAIDAAAAASSG